MKRQLIFRQQYFDSLPLDGRTSFSFFTEPEDNESSVTTMSEDNILKWLFLNSAFDCFFFQEFFKNPEKVTPFFGLTEPFTVQGQKPGDIDLLLINAERPDQVIAFECKRVKATSLDNLNSKVNNIQGIRKGVIQANKYQSLGFHQSYLMIILLDDCRHFVDYPNVMMRNNITDEVEAIYDIPWNEKLHEDVGIVFVRVTQPTGKDFNLMSGQGFCIDKKAAHLEQTITMTNKVKELLKQPFNLQSPF